MFMLVEAIVTSELDMTDDDVIETYRGLWRIEESFRITKSELEARPVYVSREDRINAHFLTCFVSLLLLRCLQRSTDKAIRRFGALLHPGTI